MYQIDGLSNIRFQVRLLKLDYLKLYALSYKAIAGLRFEDMKNYVLFIQHRYDKRDYFLPKLVSKWINEGYLEVLARHYDEKLKKYTTNTEVFCLYKTGYVESEMLEKAHFQRRGYLYYVIPAKLIKKFI